jgi:hypothetical protein
MLSGNVGLELGSGFALSEIVAKPDLFKADLNVTLQTGLSLSGESLLRDTTQDLISVLTSTGIDTLGLRETLSDSVDWFDFDKTRALSALSADGKQIAFEVGVVGSTSAASTVNFDASLKEALSDGWTTGIDFFNGVTTTANYGQLIEALVQSGVTDFVVESGNVEITDSLASAMVESGMLQALPAANLIIDATAKTMELADKTIISHLFTDFKSLAALDVDGIKVANGVSKLYIDLGLPTNDSSAIAEIKSLLASLDPANDAKLINAASTTPIDYSFATREDRSKVDVSLVMSSDLAKALLESLGSAEIGHLNHLGIKEFAVQDAVTGSFSAVVPQGVANMPEVKVIGQNTDLSDDFDPLKPIP